MAKNERPALPPERRFVREDTSTAGGKVKKWIVNDPHGSYVSSACAGRRHAPLLDIDQGARLAVEGDGALLSIDYTDELSKLDPCLRKFRWGRARRDGVFFTVPVRPVPSSTPGHFHLYIEVTTTWRRCLRLIDACYRAGIVDYNYATMVRRIGMCLLRREGHRKPVPYVNDPYDPDRYFAS